MNLQNVSIGSRVSGLFAVHFFGFGLFLPFLPVVLEFRGLTAADIGFILGAGTIARIFASPLLCNLADRSGQRRLSIIVYSLLGAAFIALFAAPGGLLVVGIAVIGYMVFKAPIVPLSDAYALDAARNAGADYAQMRLWGSVGFVAATLVGGLFVDKNSSWILLVLIFLAAALTALVVLTLPKQERAVEDQSDNEVKRTPFRSVWFWPVLTILGLYQATHSAFYGFGTLYWQALNVPDFAIGVLWAIGVIAEIALFAVAGRVSQRFDPAVFLIVAGVASIVRWGLFPLAEGFVAIGFLQVLHGLTFGAAHLGAIAILAKVVPSKWAGTGQGLLATSIGIQMAIGLAVSGALYEIDKDMPFHLMAVVSAVGVLMTLVLTPMLRRHLAETV